MADRPVLDSLRESLCQSVSLALPSSLVVISDEFKDMAETIIKNSREWLPNVKTAVARARHHGDHPTRSGETWAAMEPVLSSAIIARETFIQDIERKILKAKQFAYPVRKDAITLLKRILTEVRNEHRSLVQIFYLLKADADEADRQTRGQGYKFLLRTM